MRRWGLTPKKWRKLSDEDRDTLLAEHDLVCGSCGNLRAICSDPNVLWYPQRDVCHASAARELTLRRLQKKHEKNDRAKALKHPHPLDGMSVWVSQYDLSPDDLFV